MKKHIQDVINSYTLTDTRGVTGYTPSNLCHENQDADLGYVVIRGSWYSTNTDYFVSSCSVNPSCNP